jgi:tRNA uridine 5-carboxymethylaminomethyl modification enzyme
MREELETYPNLSIVPGSVADIIVSKDDPNSSGGKITGVRLESGEIIPTNQALSVVPPVVWVKLLLLA